MRWTWKKLVAVALVGAALGWWLSPGRAFAQPIHRPRLEVTNHRVLVKESLPTCRSTTGPGPCFFNAREDGSGSGLSYYVNKDAGRPRYVWLYRPTDANWSWVGAADDARLDTERRQRDWSRCVTYLGYFACPWREGVFTV